jgi:hypothetical protein
MDFQENGVPQGSVWCFLIAITDLEKYVKDHMEQEFQGIDMVILTYADDIAITITGEPTCDRVSSRMATR